MIEEIYRIAASTPGLRKLLRTHSECVARKAMQIAVRNRLPVDMQFLYEGAMLHDIGIGFTNAPGILCTGSSPYLCHGVLGAELLRELGMPRHALVCERHIGSGLTVDDIDLHKLPLPRRDMIPQTLEEKLICYADNFFSKSGNPLREKSMDEVMRDMERHGAESLRRFNEIRAEILEKGF